MTDSALQSEELVRPTPHAEALAELTDLGRRGFGKIEPERIARHVLRIYRDAAWPVHRAALEALLRRFAFARRDDLRVAERPSGSAFGLYRTRRPRSSVRPYRTVLSSLEPLRGNCDCPDFRRASLGLCKHLLIVLDDLAARPKVWKRALSEPPEKPSRTILTWDPIRPLHGAGDWMERIVLHDGAPGRRQMSEAERAVKRHFVRAVGEGRILRDCFAQDPRRRLGCVESLLAFFRTCARGRSARFEQPALRAHLEGERERLDRGVALHRAAPRFTRALRSLSSELYPYQLEGVKRFLAEGRLLLADDMGLGKTAQAIAACHVLARTGFVSRGLVIVPASLKHQWCREWASFSDADVQVVDGSPQERAALYRRTRKGFLIANYEQVLRDLELMQAWKPDFVVLDEAQRIKNWAAKTSHSVKELRPKYRLVLTGTPMENRLEELASIFDWVDDYALEPKWRLAPFHAERVDGTQTIAGARHLEVLRERIAPCTVRRVRGEILTQLPERTDSKIPVPLTSEQQEQHDELRWPIASLLSVRQRRPLTQAEFMKLMQLLTTQRIIANGLAQLEFKQVWPTLQGRTPGDRLLRRLASPKLGELRELVTQLVLEQGRRVVVFSQWRRMLKLAHWAVSDRLAEADLEARFFTGAEGAHRRTQNLVDFHDDDRVRILFASDAGGVGLNLQRAANACINLELPWNPAVLEQRIGRIHRLGQSDPIDTYALIGAGSLEEHIADLVADKQELFRGLFDGDSESVCFESAGNFLDGVGAALKEQVSPPGDASMDGEDGIDEEEQAQLATLAEPELEEMVRAADESGDTVRSNDAGLDLPDPEQVGRLLSRLDVQRTDGGGLRIEAPPEAAASLAAVLQGLASLLAQSSQ